MDPRVKPAGDGSGHLEVRRLLRPDLVAITPTAQLTGRHSMPGADAVSVVVGSEPAKLRAIARPTFVIAGQVDPADRLKVGGEPDDASGECQSLSRLNLPGSNGLGGEVDGVQMADGKDEQSDRRDGFEGAY